MTDGYTTAPSISPGTELIFLVIDLVLALFSIAMMCLVFRKAGRSGWAAIAPIYNAYVLCKIAGRPGWWVLLLLIPVVNLVIAIILCIDIAKAFGKSGAFGVVGLFLFGPVGFAILAFGQARYLGPNRSGHGSPPGYGGNPGDGCPGGPVPAYPAVPGYPPTSVSFTPPRQDFQSPQPQYPAPGGYPPTAR